MAYSVQATSNYRFSPNCQMSMSFSCPAQTPAVEALTPLSPSYRKTFGGKAQSFMCGGNLLGRESYLEAQNEDYIFKITKIGFR